MAEPTHRLYVDESGTKEYADDAQYPPGGGRTRYFVFAGLLVTPAEAGRLSQALAFLKRKHLGTDEIEIKANWLKRPIEREQRYLRPLGVTDENVDALIDDLYALLAGFEGELIASLVDKAEVQAAYVAPWYAPAIAYECLMQRAQLAMEEVDGTVGVTVDDMTGATPKGNEYKDNLTRHHRALRAFGSRLRNMPMNRLADIRFSDSKADERLQLADLVAYAVYRQFVDHGPAWDGPASTLKLYRFLGRIWGKFRRGDGDIVAGYGIAKFPRKAWNRWMARKSAKKSEP